MGQIADRFTNKITDTNNDNDNDESFGDLICPKCNSQILIEIIQSKERFILRYYCLCGTFTTNINGKITLLMKSSNIYQICRCQAINNNDFISYNDSSIKKYCVECDNFLCDKCLKMHKHKNIIDAKNYIYNCIFHRDTKTIGFCRKCKISFCDKCIENNYHNKKHDIIYLKNLKDIDDIVKTYESNLKNAFNKFRKLINILYGQKLNTLSNLFEPIAIPPKFNENEKDILLCLELLKTFLDIYKYKQKNNLLDYQSIAHIIKHRDFEVLKTTEPEIKNTIVSSSRIISIGSENYKKERNYIEQKSKMIYINLKIYLKEREEKKENEMNIEFDKYIHTAALYHIINLVKLKNGSLASLHYKGIEFIKNFGEPGKMINEADIIDFVELDNENICILRKWGYYRAEIIIYKRMDNGDYEKIKAIDLNEYNPQNLNDGVDYYKIISISNNNMALLSFTSLLNNEKSIFSFLQYPDYKINHIKLLDSDFKGDMIQMDNFIIICFALLDNCSIYYYNIANNTYESINIESHQTYEKPVKCFKINENKILISTVRSGIIYNIKIRQAEAFIKDFKNIDFFANIGNYQLVVKKNIISQINFKKGRLFNKYKIAFEKIINKSDACDISVIIDLGNNKFCVPLYSNTICLFNFN